MFSSYCPKTVTTLVDAITGQHLTKEKLGVTKSSGRSANVMNMQHVSSEWMRYRSGPPNSRGQMGSDPSQQVLLDGHKGSRVHFQHVSIHCRHWLHAIV
jgi:hypothetical protein